MYMIGVENVFVDWLRI